MHAVHRSQLRGALLPLNGRQRDPGLELRRPNRAHFTGHDPLRDATTHPYSSHRFPTSQTNYPRGPGFGVHYIARFQMVVNLAQAYKWKGDEVAVEKTLRRVDWSPCGHVFQIAVAVLRNDFHAAATKMAEAGPNVIAPGHYRDWPLFKEFRKSPFFLDSFSKLFGQEFKPLEVSPLDKMLTAINTLKVSDLPVRETPVSRAPS